MIAYDDSFDPPAIVVPAVLSGVVHAQPVVNVQAVIDTGADITAIPEHLAESLRLFSFSRIQMEDARGNKAPVFTYEAKVGVLDRGSVILEVILAPFPFAVLGRDWLSEYYLLLNGPDQQFLLSESPLVTENR